MTATTPKTSYYTHYIALPGGQLFPRTPAGFAEAKALPGVEIVRPARPESEGFDRHDEQTMTAADWDDVADYGCVIDRGNSAAFAKP